MIAIPLPKGSVLLLTAEEYRRGLQRGKALRRRQAFERRLVQRSSRSAANTPAPPTIPNNERDDE
jgi:hypothetical protein